jgi:hypothetical protein
MKLVYGIIGVIAAIAAVVIGVLRMPDVMIVATVLAVMLLVAANADRISKVRASVSGIEAETREVINEARATIEQLRLVGKLAAETNLSLVMRAGRWGGFSYDEKERTRQLSTDALRRLGFGDTEIDDIFREWHMVTRFDYAYHLLGGGQMPPAVQLMPPWREEWSTLHAGGFSRIASPDEIERFLRKVGLLDAEAAALLEDYRFYEKNKRHRRPDVWRMLIDRER